VRGPWPAGLLWVVVAALTVSTAYGSGRSAQAVEPSSTAMPLPALPPSASFTHLTPEQGLAGPIDTEITQDAQGFMWLGTYSGLDRYDGYRFVHYTHDDADPNTVSGNTITALYADTDGMLGRCARRGPGSPRSAHTAIRALQTRSR